MNRLLLNQRVSLAWKKVFNQSTKRQYQTEHGVYGYRPKVKASDAVLPNENVTANANLYRLVCAYREHGHRNAQVDPLKLKQAEPSRELDLSFYGLAQAGGDVVNTEGILQMSAGPWASVSDIVKHLEDTYCGTMAVEFSYIQDMAEREWFASRYEELKQQSLTNEEKVHHAKLMLKSQGWDHFLANKFTTVKRYGGEGAEAAMCFYDELFRLAAKNGIEDIVTCIAHRGRLNLMTCLLDYPPQIMFRKMRGLREFPADVKGSGDVLSHLTSSVDLKYGEDSVHVTMVPNPSHLEAANPVAVGKTRAREMSKKVGHYAAADSDAEAPMYKSLCLQIHGDAAFAGQGVVAETFCLADVPHYSIGGSIHLIVNNQIGFTTPADRARSSSYSSCVAKMNNHPVIRVNGDHPDDVVRACRLATEYRQKFNRDVIVDLMCYRKYGHNEVDDPSFTQPHMYNAVKSRGNVPDLYAQKLVSEGVCSQEELSAATAEWTAALGKSLADTESYAPKANHLERQWTGLRQPSSEITKWDTGVSVDLLKFVGAKSVTVPEDMKVHPTLVKTHIKRRIERLEKGDVVDWASAEAMAVGSLLHQGYNVRISGQDVGRGTFSHRHWMLVDQETDSGHIPLNEMTPQQTGQLEVCNSLLSEEAVLGFEYGMSTENPNLLAIWEAQFGDFFNGAQIMVDTFVTCGETKWLLQSSLVMMLPHGMDGAGPEHSSCRMERFLQCTDSKEAGIDGDDVNYQIVNPTTPAQYFHLLRRQMVRPYRKPLVIVAPKVLLRHPSATSALTDMAPGTSFQSVLADPDVDPAKVKKVVFVTGRLYYVLAKERADRGIKDMAIIRLEELCPFPAEAIQKELQKYKNAEEFVWSQEEHRNMGAWSFIAPRFSNVIGQQLRYVGRVEHATSAAGVGAVHKQESQELIDATFA